MTTGWIDQTTVSGSLRNRAPNQPFQSVTGDTAVESRRVDSRQLIRTVAVVLAALALGFLGWRMNTDDPGRPASSDETPYATVVRDLQSLLAVYGGLAQQVAQHDQAHFVEAKLIEIESSLGDVESRAEALGTDGGDGVAVLAGFVRVRGADVRAQAAADHTGTSGVAVLQAFGREVSLRAVRIGGALSSLDEAGADVSELEDEVAQPWPTPDQEGIDEPVPG